MQPRIEALLTSEREGAPMQPHDEVVLVPGVGIEGDRYATHQGHWSDPKWPDQELTLIEAEAAEILGLPAEALRRNIVTRDADLAELIGVRFRIGEALIEGVRPCDPCRYIEELTRPGVLKELAAMGGGLRARIIEGGRISVGDALRLTPPR